MAPTPDELSAPGAVSYDSSTLTVGDGTWDFSKNTFLLPNLQGLDVDTMRYNGMGNRFSTLDQYHTIVLAHGVMAAIIFLFVLPFSVMITRFYSRRPGWAIKYHAQLNIFAGFMLVAVFTLGFFAVGQKRSLTNPHHGIGVAIFVMFFVQIVGGRLVKKITKARSLRIMLHQWFGRAVALLGIVQIPLGLTLYGSPLYLFILYAVWMAFLVFVYFVLSYRSTGRRELYMDGPRSEIGRSEVTRTRLTESEYFASDAETERPSSKAKWLGPLAVGAGIWALMRGRKKDADRSRSRSPSYRSRGPEVVASRRGSASYLSEKYSELPPPKKSSGGGFMKTLGGMAAALGAGKLVSGVMDRRERRRDDEYSAVSTETPKKYRASRGAPTMTELSTELTEDTGLDGTRTSLIPPSGTRTAAMAQARSAADAKLGSKRPVSPRPSHARNPSRRSLEESDYSSYVSPSRRPIDDRPSGGGGFAQGLLSGLGMGWLSKKMADRQARRDEEQRLREEEEMRSTTEVSRFTGDGHPSPTKRYSRRPPRRSTGPATAISSEMTESSIEERPPGGNYGPQTEVSTIPTVVPGPAPGRRSRSRSGSRPRRNNTGQVSMPDMPDDPRGILHPGSDATYEGRPRRQGSSRRPRGGRAGGPADEEASYVENRERYASPSSQPVSVKLKVHDDRDRNVTLRRLTEEEALAARGRRTSESSLSDLDSPSYDRRHYRRDSSQRRAEAAAERRAEEEGQDDVAPLSPPNPAFGAGRQGKDSAYYSAPYSGRTPGHLAPSGTVPAAGQTATSLASARSHGTWSQLSPEPSVDKPSPSAAADNRRRRRQERRRGSSVTGTSRATTQQDMYD